MQLTECKLLADIDERDIQSLLSCLSAKTKSFDKSSYVWLAGDDANDVGLLLSGELNVVQEDILGNRNILRKLKSGEMFGETFALAGVSHYPVSVEVTADAKVMLLNLNKILHQCSSACVFHAQLIQNLIQIVAQKNIELSQKIGYLNKKNTRQKIASMLINHMHSANDTSIKLGFSREEMADYLGINRSALSREISQMAEEGLFSYKRDNFSILDIKALSLLIVN